MFSPSQPGTVGKSPVALFGHARRLQRICNLSGNIGQNKASYILFGLIGQDRRVIGQLDNNFDSIMCAENCILKLIIAGAGFTKVLAVAVANGDRIHYDGCSGKL